jgi:CheY-like chemotaxis protein
VITALIVEPDMTAQRKLLTMLGGRGHRAIPAATAEDAADLVQRMAFDVVFCAVRLPGLNWVELFQRVRRRVGAFALLTEGYDSEAARAFKGGEGQILPKPIDDRALDNFLALVDVRHAAARR